MQSSSQPNPKISPEDLNRHLDLYEKLNLAVFPIQSAEPGLPDEVRMLAAKMPVHIGFLHLANRSWWWRRWMRRRLQNSNLGVRTGRRFNLIILDIDFHKGAPPITSIPNLPPTLTVKTTFGLHLYYRLPKNTHAIPTTHNVFMQGVDVRGEFSFASAPPSIHASGAQYRFENPDMEIATLPDSIIQKLRSCKVTRFFYLRKFHRNFSNIQKSVADARRQSRL